MVEPITGTISNIASTIGSTIQIAGFISAIKNAPKDVEACLDLVQRVDQDINFAANLREKLRKQLSQSPDNLKRLDEIIQSAYQSIDDVGRLLEGCRAAAYGGKVPMAGKVGWVVGDAAAFEKRTRNLQQQHNAITAEIGYLRNLELLQPLRNGVSNTIENTIFENLDLLRLSRSPSRSSFRDHKGFPPPYTAPIPAQEPSENQRVPAFIVPTTTDAVPTIEKDSSEQEDTVYNSKTVDMDNMEQPVLCEEVDIDFSAEFFRSHSQRRQRHA